jgi:hypothetical protein
MAAIELELMQWAWGVMNGDTTLKNSGIHPDTGAARSVAIYREPRPDAPLPYVRFNVTDTMPLDEEPFGYTFVPTAETLFLMLSVFSPTETECYSITGRLKELFKHRQVVTTTYTGSTWLQSVDYFIEPTSNPDRSIRRSGIRIRVNLEPAA